MIKINQTWLCKATYLYLAMPLFIFLLTWLDYGFAFIFTLIFVFALYKTLKSTSDINIQWQADKNILLMAVGFALVWCFFAGIGYFYYQSWDYHFRNAVFRDLINYNWPVFYNLANTPMVYYMGFWLLPAGISKIIWTIGQFRMAFYIGNVLLYLYAVLGTCLIFLHIACALHIQSRKKMLIACLIFIFFSGLDIIGYLFFQIAEPPFAYHLDWWASFMQYSSMTTSMFWVFNQFIVTALAIFLVYNERAILNFGFLIPLLLFLAPYPTAGVGFFMVFYALTQFCKQSNKMTFVCTNIFSIQNIIGVFWLLPVLVLYFITNSEGMDRLWYIFDFTTPQRLVLFMVLEFLLYVGVLFSTYKKDFFFKTAVFLLIFIPFFRLDQQNNFCMRASQPALMILALFTIRFLFENFKTKKVLSGILVVLLLIGSATPLMEFYRGFHYVYEAGKINLVKDEIYTLNQPFVRMPEFGWDANHQYTAKNYKTDIFWRYLAKRASFTRFDYNS